MRTLADLSGPLNAMHALAAEYPLLPAARIGIEIIPEFPDELVVSCFSSLADFEQWREALRADTVEVEHSITAVGHVHLLAIATFDGVTVRLHGYSPQTRPLAAEAVAA